jgi:hypothetical protein
MDVNDELERIWKDTIVAYFKAYLSIFLEGQRNVTKNISRYGWSPG